MSVADLFDVGEGDTIWDAWLTAVNLLDMLEHSGQVPRYDFGQVRDRIAKICATAELHSIDKSARCTCGLSDAEHALLRRKILTFFRMQVNNLKHFLF